MSRILVLGGYGGFGARLSRRLAARGHMVLVAGRRGEAAAEFCRSLPGAEPVVMNRNGNLAGALDEHRPDLVIDAAGPFQASGYQLVEACIAAHIPYVDLADGRDFVGGISAFDQAARGAGIAIISGASSVPALSGAVARALAADMESVARIESVISASNRATAGLSVATAILSYVGQPVRLWRGGRWSSARGWQLLRRQTFLPPDGKAFRRWVALAEVPDHAILPTLLPGAPTTIFRAGPELAIQTLGLWLLSWPVRWGLLRSLMPVAPALRRLHGLTAGLGGDRSAMAVTLDGFSGDAGVRRCWTLVADRGHGPEIPTMAAELVAVMILTGEIPAGARHAAGLLALDQFGPLFGALAITEQIRGEPRPPLYVRVLGRSFALLPDAVRQMHTLLGHGAAEGRGSVRRGAHPLARLIGAVMRFPPAGDYPVRVDFDEEDGVERWTRDFGGHRFSSRLGEADGALIERFGPLRFRFTLPVDETGLEMRLAGWSLFGIPLPRVLAPRIRAREWQEAGDFRFEVEVTLPLIGLIVQYAGYLRRLHPPRSGEDEFQPNPSAISASSSQRSSASSFFARLVSTAFISVSKRFGSLA